MGAARRDGEPIGERMARVEERVDQGFREVRQDIRELRESIERSTDDQSKKRHKLAEATDVALDRADQRLKRLEGFRLYVLGISVGIGIAVNAVWNLVARWQK